MSERQDPSGAQFRADRPAEQEAVRTTIVGGRPPGSGQSIGQIPRGIEVLVKKASVDPQFKAVLLSRRAEAADEIGLALDPAEAMMLTVVPAAQLESIIAQTSVPDRDRRAFLGKVAAAMLATIGLTVPGCGEPKGCRPDVPKKPKRENRLEPTGSAPDRPPDVQPPAKSETEAADDTQPSSDDRPDKIPVPEGMRPDRLPAPTGSRPQ